jgi:hypothetical protein
MPPFAYIWPALFGAEHGTVKLANSSSRGRPSLRLPHGEAPALGSRGARGGRVLRPLPTTRQFLATALSEGPYFLPRRRRGSVARRVLHRRARAYLAISAVALGLATLTRGSLFYLLPCWWSSSRGSASAPHGGAHLVALAFPIVASS